MAATNCSVSMAVTVIVVDVKYLNELAWKFLV